MSTNTSPQTTPRVLEASPRVRRRAGSRRGSNRKRLHGANAVSNLHRAALSRDVALIEHELEGEGATFIDGVDEGSGDTALMTCIRVGADDCVLLLLKRGATMSTRTSTKQSCLHIAACGGHTKILGKLLSVVEDGVVNETDVNGGTALFYAAQGGHLECVKEILGSLERLELDAIHHSGGSALCAAAQLGSIECCNLLLEAKADIEASRMRDGATPLMIATLGNDWQTVKFLIDAGADIDVTLHGKTLSQASAKYGDGSVAKELALNPPVRKTPAPRAILDKSREFALALEKSLAAGMSSPSLGRPPAISGVPTDLWSASIETLVGNQDDDDPTPKLLTFLLEQIELLGGMQSEGLFRLSCGEDNVTQLKQHLASVEYGTWSNVGGERNPNVPAVVLKRWLRELPVPLLDDYASVIGAVDDNRVQSYSLVVDSLAPSHRAVLQQLLEFLLRLLPMQKFTKMTEENLAIVFSPSIMRNPSEDPLVLIGNQPKEQKFVMNLLEWYDALFTLPTPRKEITPTKDRDVFEVIEASDDLRESVVSGDLDGVEKALRKGADIETKTHEKGDSVLISAARHKRHAILKRLIASGANLEMRNSIGATALCVGAFIGDETIVNILIDAKADVNARDLQDACPLYGCVVTNGNVNVVEALLKAQADINATRKQLSCLMVAAKNNLHDVAKLLLQYGADYNLLSKTGKTAAQISAKSGDGVVAGYINSRLERLPDSPMVDSRKKHKKSQSRKKAGSVKGTRVAPPSLALNQEELVAQKPERKAGDIVMAKWTDDGLWYKARVLKVHGDLCDVQFVDYGNEQLMTKESDITDLPQADAASPKKNKSGGKLQGLHSMDADDETVKLMLKKGTSTSPRNNECAACKKLFGPKQSKKCTECHKRFCHGCGHKVLLASLGETSKRFVCNSCFLALKEKIKAAASPRAEIAAPSTPPPKAQSDSVKFGTMGRNGLAKNLFETALSGATQVSEATTSTGSRRKAPPSEAPPRVPTSPRPTLDTIKEFTVAQVALYFRDMGATEEHVATLKKEMIDGDSLLEFSSADLKSDLGLPFGLIKKHMRNIDQ